MNRVRLAQGVDRPRHTISRWAVTLLLCVAGVLRDPLLYPSLYFKQQRDRYYSC
jgi:hypothetical protein